MLSSIILASLLCSAALTPMAPPQEQNVSRLWVDVLHVGNGEVLENVLVELEKGKIVAVVPGGKIPSDAIRVDGAHLTPGLVDAFSYMAVDQTTVEESRETTASEVRFQTAQMEARHRRELRD